MTVRKIAIDGDKRKTRLAREAAKLDVREERSLAEEALGKDTWPEY